MDFAFTEEQDMLRAAARGWLAEKFPAEWVAELASSDAGWDPGSWPELHDLGWLDSELELLDLAVLAEEAGSTLAPVPWFTSVGLAGPAYAAAGRPLDRPATLAWADDGAATLLAAAGGAVACTAEPAGDGFLLTGTKVRVPDGGVVAEAAVVARTPDGPALFAVDLAASPDLVVRRETLDSTRRYAELRLAGTPAAPLLDAARTPAVLAATRRRALALLACEAVGVTGRALDLAVDYARTRTQFDRPIGSYQGVSHRLSNVYLSLQLARSLAYRAAWCVSTDDPDTDEAVATATVSAGEAAVTGCENAIQALGGTGFTFDHPLHRLYRRAQWIRGFDGLPGAHRADLAALILDRV